MRRMNGIGLVVILIILALVEYYSFTAIKFSLRNWKPINRNFLLGFYLLLTLAWVSIIFVIPSMREEGFNKLLRNTLITFGMGLLITKLIIASILFIDDLRRIVYIIAGLFYNEKALPNNIQNGMTRSEFMTKMALLFGGTIFGTMIYGMTNRYNYKIKNISLNFDNLPDAFKGLKIIQISDIHSGSFTNPDAVAKGVELINAQKPDVIFFTGDLVNNKSDEMTDYISVFSKLAAPLGVYSIFGNHDYGDYVAWENEPAKIANLEKLKSIHKQLGWRLLLNEHVVLDKDQQQIAVIGVENISAKGFHSYGDLSKAHAGSELIPFKILLSHDPSHWDSETNQNFKDIDLTLAGHTHGMQFGVEIPWIKWSPVQYMYKQWAGIYQKEKQYLYVNRGFGFLGYPGRIGIMPEITVINLS